MIPIKKQYYVSKLSKKEDDTIESVFVYQLIGKNLLDYGFVRSGWWLENQLSEGNLINTITKNWNGRWIRGGAFSCIGNKIIWNPIIPRNIEKRNVFISFRSEPYDKWYKRQLENILDDLIINQSVRDGDILPDNSADYIRHLIQQGYLKDTTVQIVLIGNHTKNRKHVDWEIYGALDQKVGNRYAGLLGLILPNHPDFGKPTARYALMPKRLAANFNSGYAVIRDWTSDRRKLQDYIEEAFERRRRDDLIVNHEIPQMQRNLLNE